VLRDDRFALAQSGDLSLGGDMGDAQLPSRIFTSDPIGGALRSGRPISVDASTVRKGLRDTGEVEVEVGPMMWRVSFTAWRAWCWRRALAPPRGHHLLMTVLQIRGVAPRATMKV